MFVELTSPAFWIAVAQIIAIDVVLSGDNAVVIALACRNLNPELRRKGIFWGVAGAAHGSLFLLLFGLAVSIPLIIWSSQLILKLMERWPLVVTLGAALLGYVSGQMIATDPGLAGLLADAPSWLPKAAGMVGALLVVAAGKLLEARQPVDITVE